MTMPTINEEKMQKFMEKIVSDIGASYSAVLVYIGDKLGLYRAMAEAGAPVSPLDLSKLTNTSERYVKEWLANQAAGGYIQYHSDDEKYSLPLEHVLALVDGKFPGYAIGSFQIAMSLFKDEPMIEDAFRNNKGIKWSERDADLFYGIERYFKPIYEMNLTRAWIPSLLGMEEKLKKGCNVADIGCGHGTSSILMSKAYPNSTFFGFDLHKPSIERARQIADKEKLGKERLFFDVASSTDYPNNHYDLITFFACLHDMGDPIGAAYHAMNCLNNDGTLMINEPFAYDKLEYNLNTLGRLFYATSTLICIPTSLSQNGPALGSQAGEKRIREIITSAGFKHIRIAAQTPFNMIFEVRP